ncbi:hypothetical protein EYF80_022721 [Liparis tanakae]|uniref:Uncharacterized protein n=1 Tax=Liparis tanakae TaxID=230148 RepID=A0A4Z2HP85_9TELE|nr:hypothetical protein EYF80_022721 [Liparis tanakae]
MAFPCCSANEPNLPRLRKYQALPTKVAPEVQILGEQGPQSHVKKWTGGVRLERGVWRIAVPCKHQDKGATQQRSMCGPRCRRRGLSVGRVR